MKKKLGQNNYVMLYNENVEKRTKIWNIKLMQQMLIEIEPTI